MSLIQRASGAAFGLATSADYRRLFWYRRWASERRPYKSRHGQDWWVDRTLRHKRGGFFVDLAAADGVWMSNTHFFEHCRGWDGICIEPNGEMFAKLISTRTVRCVERCVSDRVGDVEFRVDRGIAGGIVADDTRNERGGTVVSMLAVPLTDLLDELGAPRYIDYMSLDVEGAEERVIRGLDLDRYSFGLMTIERPTDYIDARLREHGYRPVVTMHRDVGYQGRHLPAT